MFTLAGEVPPRSGGRGRSCPVNAWAAWGWTYVGEARPHAIVRYEADFTEPDYPWLRLRPNE